ncbi:LOG family protein [Mycoplasmopsis sturni]|uniref:hypothetical protein n=1 Tax=Mycoplasmopsis sturni TaxID=39047 RepID=UPI00055FF6AC|nr:hypothetical protein [Mycoplasmopsis sturni]
MNKILLYLIHKFQANTFLIYQQMRKTDQLDSKDINYIAEIYKNSKIEFIDIYNSNYPIRLLKEDYPPFGFFAKGNLELLDSKYDKIYLIHEKEDPIIEEYIHNNLPIIAKNSVLVTNQFASEKKIIKEFQKLGGKIVYILKSGLDNVTNDIDSNELYLSLYPLFTHPKRQYFKESNMFAAALCDQVLIFSTIAQTKADHLISCFLAQGIDINCFPGTKLEDYNNTLIQNGANLVTKVDASRL